MAVVEGMAVVGGAAVVGGVAVVGGMAVVGGVAMRCSDDVTSPWRPMVVGCNEEVACPA